jgi:suppressor for copper-sensitivity B
LLPGKGVVSAEAASINSARATVPGTPAAAGIDVDSASIVGTGSEHRLVVDLRSKAEPFVRPDLFIEGAGDGIPATPEVDLHDGGRTARLSVRLARSLPPDRSLTLTLTDGHRAAEFAVPSSAVIMPHVGLLVALASALLGGLILNLMPCVLPVLSIKLFAFSRHAGGKLHEVRLGSAATAAGIVTSFLLLAVILVALKWYGGHAWLGYPISTPLVFGWHGSADGPVRRELF